MHVLMQIPGLKPYLHTHAHTHTPNTNKVCEVKMTDSYIRAHSEEKLRKDHTDTPCAPSTMTELSVPLFSLFHEVFLMLYMPGTFPNV